MNISTDFSKASDGREILIQLEKTNKTSLAEPINKFSTSVGEFRTSFRSIGRGAVDYDFYLHKIVTNPLDIEYDESRLAKVAQDYIASEIKILIGRITTINNYEYDKERAKAIEHYLSKKIFKYSQGENNEQYKSSPDHVIDVAVKLREKLLNELLSGRMETAQEKTTPEYKKSKEEKNKEAQLQQISKEIVELKKSLGKYPTVSSFEPIFFEDMIKGLKERRKLSSKAEEANAAAQKCLENLHQKIEKGESLENFNFLAIDPDQVSVNFFKDEFYNKLKELKAAIVNPERDALLKKIKEKEDARNMLKGIPVKITIPESAPTIIVEKTNSDKPLVNPPNENVSQPPKQKKSCIDKFISFFSAIGNAIKRCFKFIFRLN